MDQLNTAFYCFAPLGETDGLKALKKSWLDKMRALGVKGTIILAPEGLNGFLAGPENGVRSALALIQSLPALAGLRVKESWSARAPFAKLCVKIKKEIVTFRVPELPPLSRPAKRLAPAELAEWYRQGREFVALDTRNEFEARLGQFAGAVSLGIDHFVELPEKAYALPADWKTKPVVTFCTGGIRCEKAAPYLESMGFEEVYQLDGGILAYFAEVGGEHWEGECFVFDERVALGPDLLPTGAHLCAACQWPVRRGEEACGHCHKAVVR